MQYALEAAMLFCFSASWYCSIATMLRTRRASGKSAAFVALVVTGYAFGIASKLLAWEPGTYISPLVYLYAWNFGVTLFDLYLVAHFSAAETRNESHA